MTKDQENYLHARIEALETEVKRLNKKVKKLQKSNYDRHQNNSLTP